MKPFIRSTLKISKPRQQSQPLVGPLFVCKSLALPTIIRHGQTVQLITVRTHKKIWQYKLKFSDKNVLWQWRQQCCLCVLLLITIKRSLAKSLICWLIDKEYDLVCLIYKVKVWQWCGNSTLGAKTPRIMTLSKDSQYKDTQKKALRKWYSIWWDSE